MAVLQRQQVMRAASCLAPGRQAIDNHDPCLEPLAMLVVAVPDAGRFGSYRH
jgi:hypothetical protein